MTDREMGEILAMLKVAYPQQLNKLSSADAGAMIKLWRIHFASIPYDVMTLVIQRYIPKHEYYPGIKQIKDEIRALHCKAVWALQQHRQEIEYGIGKKLTDDVYKQVQYIADCTDDRSTNTGDTLLDVLDITDGPMLGQTVKRKASLQRETADGVLQLLKGDN